MPKYGAGLHPSRISSGVSSLPVCNREVESRSSVEAMTCRAVLRESREKQEHVHVHVHTTHVLQIHFMLVRRRYPHAFHIALHACPFVIEKLSRDPSSVQAMTRRAVLRESREKQEQKRT